MASSRDFVLPPKLSPPDGKELRKDQQLYNNLLGQLSTMGVGWRPCSTNTGANFINKLAHTLWYLDPHHDKFFSRGIHIPERFMTYKGYNDYKKKKEKEPRLSNDGLQQHIEQLNSMLMQPWMSSKRFDIIRTDIEHLLDALCKYKEYLSSRNESMKEHHQSLEPRSVEDNSSLITLSPTSASSSSRYLDLERRLLDIPYYEPLFVNDIAPSDRIERRKWLTAIALPFTIMLYKFAYGNNLGTLVYAWRIPKDEPVDSTVVGRIFSELCHQQSFYSSRAMRRDFLSKYTRLANVPKMILRNIYHTLLHDSTSPEYAGHVEVDERVANAVLHVDDPELILDLRRANGRPNSTIFDRFWEELQAYFDEQPLAVDERRHGDVLHMPLAISIRQLQEAITERLKKKFPDAVPPIPSQEWIRLQFWPTNPFSDRALRYTGRFEVKFGVQVRQLRKDHVDRHYVSALLQYLRTFAVQYRTCMLFVSVDDKCIIPVGEPACPVSTGVRGHNRSLVPLHGPQLQALDHDFHLHGIVPSVAFFVDVPGDSSDSFFTGQPFVTNKDKVTQPSHTLRHATELTDLIRTHFSEDGLTSAQPIAVVVSDGGPDHRVTFGSVKVSCLTLFRALDLDMLICVRTCPYQSWQNVAERIMSTLNLALQNVSLARTSMPHRFEQLVKSKGNLSEIREAIKAYPELEDALRDSMSTPMITVGQRFQAMKVKDKMVKLGVPASDPRIQEQFQHALFVDPALTKDDLTAKGLKKAESFAKFVKTHCHASHYVFQIKKCLDATCFYCVEHPVRLPDDVFSSLTFLPLPLLDKSNKEHYQKFRDLYGQLPTEVDRPSLVPTPSEESKERDKGRKALLVCGKVRCTITCGECHKPRCVYSMSKLTAQETSHVAVVKNSNLYTCGASLFPPGSNYEATIVVREAIVCSTNIESQYYSSVLIHFPPVCYYCGQGEEALVENEEVKELKASYAVVYPICFLCHSEGKRLYCKRTWPKDEKRDYFCVV